MKRIVVQAGHMKPLQPGFEGDTGAKGEAELVADIQRALVRLLSHDDNFHGIPMPGRIDDSVQCDAAIFLHADGVTDPSANGFAVGFPAFDVNRRLAHLIAEEIEKLPGHPRRRPDNGTADMAKYYGFRHIDTPGPEVIVEHGFVTNPGEHQWLKDHVEELAQAELNALRRFFGSTGAAAAETPIRPRRTGRSPWTARCWQPPARRLRRPCSSCSHEPTGNTPTATFRRLSATTTPPRSRSASTRCWSLHR